MTGYEGEPSGQIRSTERSFVIIEKLRRVDEAGVSELAESMDAAKSTVHNHLRTLESLGYVVNTGTGYSLGLKFLDLGDRARKRYPLYYASRGEMDQLVETVGERGQVMVQEDGEGVYIYQVRTDQAVQTDSHIGTRVNLHATAVGKSYLAFLSETDRDRILGESLQAMTADTITDRAALEAELETVRDRGFAFNDGEKTAGMRAVGAPIISDDDTVLGAISVSGPTTRMSGEWYRSDVPELVSQAARVIGIKATYA